MGAGFPLSPLQAVLWRVHESEPHFPSAASLALSIEGPLEERELRAALAALVARHEILRTRFACAGTTPQQEVEAAAEVALELHDWSALAADGSTTLESRARELARALCAPRHGDGSARLRAALARLAPGRHVLVLAQSALAADWRSLWNAARELGLELAGHAERAQPAQFADLAQWLHDTLAGDEAATGLAFWKRVDLASAADLRPALEFDRGPRALSIEETRRALEPELEHGLAHLAASRRVALESLLCAAWQVWLARSSERPALVLGARSGGRAFQGLEQALGSFERFLPVSARLDERTSLLQLARRTDEQLSEGAEWHEFFQPERLGAGPDFAFRQAFEFLPREEPFEAGGRRFAILARGGHAEPFRGLLRVEQGPTASTLALCFDPRFLAASDAAVALEQVATLLASALAHPDAPALELALSSPAERAQVLAAARGPALPAQPGTEPRCLHEWILERARERPEACAVQAGGVELDYRTLEQRSGALALELEARGVGPGARVGVHLERSSELVVALLAVLRAGGAYVPLPPSYPRERVLMMLADSKAELVLGSAATSAALAGFRGEIVHAHAGAGTPGATRARSARVAPGDLAYVIYTSGSSGKPKGVPITHANLTASTRARLAYYPDAVERYLLLSSFAFDSSVAGLFWTLVQGGTLLLPPEGFERELAGLPALIARTRPTHLLALPSLWSLVLESARAEELASLATVIVAGESCTSELVRRHHARLPATRLYNEYGPTEGTVWSTVFDTATPCERLQVPIGRPIPGASNYVLGPDRELAPLGIAGELWIAGPGIASGYLERPDLTAERFAPDPFAPWTNPGTDPGRMYRTGDRARLLLDGNLEFLGRLDQQVKIRGYRIELEEIEAALATHPAVREAVVLARATGPLDAAAQLVAYVRPLGTAPLETDLLRYLGERLPEYMLPARAVCLAQWPLLPNGKVDKKALPAPRETEAFAAPEGALELVLAALWADVLGREAIGRHDDFFALGGHSLSATRLYARLRETLQVALPLRTLFERRTPAALAEVLRRDPTERARVERLAELVLSVLESEEEPRALGA